VDVGLTRKQIENSPSIDSQKPVSRQHEEEYHKYFGWPPYWNTDAASAIGPQPERKVHLCSAQAVNGYLVRMGEETIGHISDFMIDAESWVIGQLVVKTGHRLSGKDILIEMKQVDRIGYDESTIFAHLNPEISESAAANHLTPSASGI
jgi:hypothetical protein